MIPIETSNLLFFIGAAFLLIIAPGPDIVFLITQGIVGGPRAGFATAMGLALGNLVHTLAAALGVSVVFRASPLAFHGLKLLGVAYLLFLAWKAVRNRDSRPPSLRVSESESAPTIHLGALFGRGFLMNVLNPKVAIFFLAFLPQFVLESTGPVWTQMVFYGVLFTAMVILVFGAIGVLSGRVGRWLVSSGSARGIAGYSGWIVACVYLVLAVRLALIRK